MYFKYCVYYFNGLFSTLDESSHSHLQTIQNAAARLSTHSSKQTHISPIFYSSCIYTQSIKGQDCRVFIPASASSSITGSKHVVPTRLKTNGSLLVCRTCERYSPEMWHWWQSPPLPSPRGHPENPLFPTLGRCIHLQPSPSNRPTSARTGECTLPSAAGR